jgi:hypothetical protein
MKALKIFAIALIVALLACGMVACSEPTQTEATPTPQPTEDPQQLAAKDARGALSTYLANTSSNEGIGVEVGTVFVVEKLGKWYSFTFLDGQLEFGDISDIEIIPEGLVLETDGNHLCLIPDNVTIYIPEPKS